MKGQQNAKPAITALKVSSVFKLAIAKALLKIDAVADELALTAVYLFGSCARGTATVGSDVDILLVTRLTNREVRTSQAFADIDDDTLTPAIQLTVITSEKFKEATEHPDPGEFASAIQSDLILLRRY